MVHNNNQTLLFKLKFVVFSGKTFSIFAESSEMWCFVVEILLLLVNNQQTKSKTFFSLPAINVIKIRKCSHRRFPPQRLAGREDFPTRVAVVEEPLLFVSPDDELPTCSMTCSMVPEPPQFPPLPLLVETLSLVSGATS